MILDAWSWCTETTQRDSTGREDGGGFRMGNVYTCGGCTGTTQRDGTGREEGEGFRMGNTCIPVVDSC